VSSRWEMFLASDVEDALRKKYPEIFDSCHAYYVGTDARPGDEENEGTFPERFRMELVDDDLMSEMGKFDVSLAFAFDEPAGGDGCRLRRVDRSRITVSKVENGKDPKDRQGQKGESGPAIPASAYSDDRMAEVEFDAVEWFRQAGPDEIVRLAECGFGGDYPADAVVLFFEEKHPGVRKLFGYLESIRDLPSKKDCHGFECHVDRETARKWLRDRRPEVYEKILGNAGLAEELGWDG